MVKAYITNDNSKRKRQLIKDIYFWRMHIMNGNEFLNYLLIGIMFAQLLFLSAMVAFHHCLSFVEEDYFMKAMRIITTFISLAPS